MKYFLFIIFLMAVILSAGCVVQNNNPPVPPTPQIIYVTFTVPVTQSVSETVMSIKGVEHSITNIQMIGNVYGLAPNPSAGITEITFVVGLAPGAPSIDLTKMTIAFITPTTGSTFITHEHTTLFTSSSTFTTKIGTTDVTSMKANDQVEVAFKVAPVPANTKIIIELRPNVGAMLPFTKSVPATIAAVNVLY